jgi:hypothetical protein
VLAPPRRNGPRFENIQAGMRQSFAQELGVASEAVGIVPPDNDCDWYLDRREARRQRSQVLRVRANERRRPRQPIALVGREIVVAHEAWHRVSAKRSQEPLYHHAGIQRR